MSKGEDFEKKLKAAPKNFYYVAVDGTEAGDSAEFGKLLEASTGWKNLLTYFLPRDATEPLRLHDAAHPYLPICMHGNIAVVSPNGRDGRGTDKLWQHYAGETPEEAPDGEVTWKDRLPEYKTVGRQTAAERSADYMTRFLLRPAVAVSGSGAAIERTLVDGEPPRFRRVFPADLLYVSSHGWLGGYMRGDRMWPFRGATPPLAVEAFGSQRAYFVVGRAEKERAFFFGPQWIVLAQCSTVNEATAGLWASVFSRSIPPVRGVLAYGESAPDATSAKGTAQAFFGQLAQGKTFLEAWKKANTILQWAAIIHRDAVGDKLQDFGNFKPLTFSGEKAPYLAFATHLLGGQDITDRAPSLHLQVEHRRFDDEKVKMGWVEVTPDILDLSRTHLRPGDFYRLTLSAEDQTLRACTVKIVHIRESYPEQMDFATLFGSMSVEPAGCTATMNGQEIQLTAKSEPESITIHLTARSKLSAPGLVEGHSYFWFEITAVTSKATLKYGFKTQGLGY